MVDSGHIFLVKMLFIYTPSKYPGVEQTTPAQLVLEIAISNSLLLCCFAWEKQLKHLHSAVPPVFVLATASQQTYVTVFA